MTDKPTIRPDAHDIPDEVSGPDTPRTIDDPDTEEARFLSAGDSPAEGRRDVGDDGQSGAQDEAPNPAR